MKKNYFMLALASMMMAACANNDLVDDLVKEEVPQAIGFETFAQKATRATENSNANYGENDLSSHHSTFKVWASKKIESQANWLEVYSNTNPGTVTYGTAWVADPLKYWDKAATSYCFYAAAPAEPDWVYTNATTSDGSTGYLTLTNYVLKGTANDNLATGANTALGTTWKAKTHDGKDLDLMIAAPCSVANDNYNKATPDKVNMDFIHILSRLNIAVKATDDNIVVKALEVHRLKNKGSFDENASLSNGEGNTPDVLASGTIKRWGTTSSVNIDTDVAYKLVGNLGTGPGLALTKNATAVYTHEYLIMPQVQTKTENCVGTGSAPSTDAYIYLEYTVNGETYKTYYGLAQAFGVTSLAFNEGWQNTLTLTISPATIEFTADAAAWATGTTYPID